MTTQGTHNEGNITFFAKYAITERYIFGKFVDGKIAPAGTNQAVAVITDCAGAEEAVNVQVLGSTGGTMKVTASSNITAGDFIISDANSKACSLKDGLRKGTYNVCGIALTNAFAGECVEFAPTLGLEKTL